MDALLTPQQIADLLGVKVSTIYQWTHQGFIPHAKIGKFVRFNMPEIEKWVQQRSTAGRMTHKIDIKQFGF